MALSMQKRNRNCSKLFVNGPVVIKATIYKIEQYGNYAFSNRHCFTFLADLFNYCCQGANLTIQNCLLVHHSCPDNKNQMVMLHNNEGNIFFFGSSCL